MGTWGRGVVAGHPTRRGWEGDRRMDLRAIRDEEYRIPYMVATRYRHMRTAQLINPNAAIDSALETVQNSQEGYGPHTLAALASFALREYLMQWLSMFKLQREHQQAALPNVQVRKHFAVI